MKAELKVEIDADVLRELRARRGLNVSALVEEKLRDFLEEPEERLGGGE